MPYRDHRFQADLRTINLCVVCGTPRPNPVHDLIPAAPTAQQPHLFVSVAPDGRHCVECGGLDSDAIHDFWRVPSAASPPPPAPTARQPHPFTIPEDGSARSRCAVCHLGPNTRAHRAFLLQRQEARAAETAECAECELTFLATALNDGVCTACQPVDMVPGFQDGDGVHRLVETRRCVVCSIRRALCRRIPGGTRSAGRYLCIPCESSLAAMRPSVLEGLLTNERVIEDGDDDDDDGEDAPEVAPEPVEAPAVLCGCGDPNCTYDQEEANRRRRILRGSDF